MCVYAMPDVLWTYLCWIYKNIKKLTFDGFMYTKRQNIIIKKNISFKFPAILKMILDNDKF